MFRYFGKTLGTYLQSAFGPLLGLRVLPTSMYSSIQTVASVTIWICLNNIYSIFLAEAYQLKNQPPPIPVANSNRAEVNKAGIPVSGKDSADSKNTDNGTSPQPNPFRKVKGMGADLIYSVTNFSMKQHESKTFLDLLALRWASSVGF